MNRQFEVLIPPANDLSMMRILALETSGTSGSVAALMAENVLCQLELDPALRSARSLAPALHQVLNEAGWRPRDVQLVAIVVGPGSFTGLRVGVTTAKAFAYAVGAEILGVDTLEVLAEQAPADSSVVHAAIDAQRQELFVATFSGTDHFSLSRVPQAATRIIAIDAWLESLEPGDVVIGPALAKLKDRLPPDVLVAPEACWAPMAANVGRIASRRYAAGERGDLWRLAPAYLRRSAAEEKAAARPKVE
jgi:tRNA threonylcarbamoyladenosine biosynthesis protein TsaB